MTRAGSGHPSRLAEPVIGPRSRGPVGSHLRMTVMRLYFAYGSNMDRAHMAKLCPKAEALGLATLKDHRFFVAHGGYGSIARKRGDDVHGVLWRISAQDLVALDAYEEIGDGLYQHAMMPVHHDGKLLRVLMYIANDPRPARPSARYREDVLNAARAWSLPGPYVAALEKEMALP